MAARKRAKRNKRIRPAELVMWVLAAIVLAFSMLNAAGILTFGGIEESLGLKSTVVSDAEVSVHFINVGQGDSVLIMSGEKSVLIDCGEKEYADEVIDYLHSQNIDKLSYIINTHPHSDHMGGMSEIIEQVGADEMLMPELPDEFVPNSTPYEKMLDAIEKSGLKLSRPEVGRVLALGSAKLEILAPLGDNYDDLNDFSIVCRLVHGTNRFLFMGDAQESAEKDMMNEYDDLSADVLKVGHHGSSTSSKKKFLAAVSPSYAVICCESGNSYNHPADSTVKRLLDVGAKIFRTDLDGTVVIESDGIGLNIITRK